MDLPRRAPSVNTSSVAIYVGALVALALFTIAALVLVAVQRPTQDNATLNTLIIGVSTPIVGSLIGLILRENHNMMNSRLDELVEQSNASSHAQGVIQGKAERRGS